MTIPPNVTMLLVEDDPDDVFLMRRALKAANIPNAVQLAETGQQAIDYLSGAGVYSDRQAHPLPQLIFLDLKLPYKTGFDVMQWMREQSLLDAIAVVVLTSSSQPRDLEKAYRSGARSYLVKPPTAKMLQEIAGTLEPFWAKQKRAGSAGTG